MNLKEVLEVINAKKEKLNTLYREEAEVRDKARRYEDRMAALRNEMEQIEKEATSIFERRSMLEEEIESLCSPLILIKDAVSSMPKGHVIPNSPTEAEDRIAVSEKVIHKIMLPETITCNTSMGETTLKAVSLSDLTGWQLRVLIWKKTGERVDRTATYKIIDVLCKHIVQNTTIPLDAFESVLKERKADTPRKFLMIRTIMSSYGYSLDGYMEDNAQIYGFHSEKKR